MYSDSYHRIWTHHHYCVTVLITFILYGLYIGIWYKIQYTIHSMHRWCVYSKALCRGIPPLCTPPPPLVYMPTSAWYLRLYTRPTCKQVKWSVISYLCERVWGTAAPSCRYISTSLWTLSVCRYISGVSV